MVKSKTKKAVGRIGDWFATVDGERLPCVHEHWAKGGWPQYYDPEARPGLLDFDRHKEGIRSKRRVILQQDEPPRTSADGKPILIRGGYVAV
jgi:hypothetical protein